MVWPNQAKSTASILFCPNYDQNVIWQKNFISKCIFIIPILMLLHWIRDCIKYFRSEDACIHCIFASDTLPWIELWTLLKWYSLSHKNMFNYCQFYLKSRCKKKFACVKWMKKKPTSSKLLLSKNPTAWQNGNLIYLKWILLWCAWNSTNFNLNESFYYKLCK